MKKSQNCSDHSNDRDGKSSEESAGELITKPK